MESLADTTKQQTADSSEKRYPRVDIALDSRSKQSWSGDVDSLATPLGEFYRMDKEIRLDSQYLVGKFGLLPHPEGGFYKETYRSNDIVTINRDCNEEIQRIASTAIYFLIVPDSVSRLHRIKSDEGTAELRSFFYESNLNPPLLCFNSLAFLSGR